MLSKKSSTNPLYLDLLVKHLVMMNYYDFADIRSHGDGMSAIEAHQLKMIETNCPDSLEDMSACLLKEAGKRINEDLILEVGQFLAVSRYGLRKKDLAAIIGDKWTDIDFAHFINYMSSCFMLRDDGRYDFTHKSIRKGFRKICKNPSAYDRTVQEYLKNLPEDDPVRISELLYHTIASDKKDDFIEYILRYQNYKDNRYIEESVREVCRLIECGKNEWFQNIIDNLTESNQLSRNHTNVARFICINLLKTSHKYLIEDKYIVELSLLESAKKLLLVIDNIESDGFVKKTLADIYEEIANILSLRRAYEGAILNYENAIKIYENDLIAENSDYIRVLEYLYYKVAYSYDRNGNYRRAIEAENHALMICKKNMPLDSDTWRYICDYSEKIADYYKKLGEKPDLLKALELYDYCIGIREKESLSDALSDSGYYAKLSIIKKCGEVYLKLGSLSSGLFKNKAYLKKAIEAYQKALELAVEISHTDSSDMAINTLADAYISLAKAYLIYGDSKNGVKEFDHGVGLKYMLHNSPNKKKKFKRELAQYYVEAADQLMRQGKTNIIIPIRYYNEALQIYESITKSYNKKNQDFLHYAECLKKMAEAYLKTKTKENAEKASQLLLRSEEVKKIILI